jgi:hypothetical protein
MHPINPFPPRPTLFVVNPLHKNERNIQLEMTRSCCWQWTSSTCYTISTYSLTTCDKWVGFPRVSTTTIMSTKHSTIATKDLQVGLKTFLGRVELLNATILDKVLQVGPWEQSWRSKATCIRCVSWSELHWKMRHVIVFFYHLAMFRGWVWMTLHMHVFTMVSNNGVLLLQVISLF